MTIDDGTPLDGLPAIIDAPGEYATRDGGRATIREIHPAPEGSATAFTAKGSMWSMLRGAYRARGHEIWHVSGRHRAIGMSGRDIPIATGDRARRPFRRAMRQVGTACPGFPALRRTAAWHRDRPPRAHRGALEHRRITK